MRKVTTLTLAGAVFALLSATPAAAAGKPMAASGKTMAANSAPMRSAWPPETLSGKITMVEPGQKLVVVQDSNGVPFDMVVTPKTRIRSGNQAITLKELTEYQNKDVSIQFVPERRGDVAESIRISG